MAKHNRKPISDAYTDTVVYDSQGKPILTMSHAVHESHDEQTSSMHTEKVYENLQLTDGSVFSISEMLKSGKDRASVSVCKICRKGSIFSFLCKSNNSHGLTPTKLMKKCHSCGSYICPKHSSISSDHRIRCKRCHRRYRLLHDWIKPIFFERVK